MSKNVILHLSDLHISEFISDYNQKLYKSRTESKDYIYNFCREVNDIIKMDNLELGWLVITGDLTNTANKKEYNQVKDFLSEILKNLNIDKNNLLLIPGNHDIYRAKVNFVSTENDSKKPHMFFQEKLETYKNFYDDYMGEGLNCCGAILFDKKDIISNNLFLGVNTLYKESHLKEDHIGWVEIESLKKELKVIQEKYYDYKELTKIALFHHAPEFSGAFENSTIKNWKQIKPILDDYNIKVYIFGHIHSELIEQINTDIYLGTGSFALLDTDITNTFSLYSIEDGQVSARLYDFRANPLKGTSGIGDWKINKNSKYDLVEKIRTKEIHEIIEENGHEQWSKSPFGVGERTLDRKEEESQVESHSKSIQKASQKNNLLSQNFIDKIKNESLFQSGHFHWGDNLKAHGWLNTNKMLGKFENVQLSVNSILYCIEKYKIDVDTIIGIGMEGNIIGAIVAINLSIKYTYVPSKEHSKYEKNINLKDSNKILFVIDTIFTGSILYKILDEYDEQLKNKEKFLISIFCTGDINAIENKVNHKVKVYSICDEVKIKLCNIKEEECPIIKYNLDAIHKL